MRDFLFILIFCITLFQQVWVTRNLSICDVNNNIIGQCQFQVLPQKYRLSIMAQNMQKMYLRTPMRIYIMVEHNSIGQKTVEPWYQDHLCTCCNKGRLFHQKTFDSGSRSSKNWPVYSPTNKACFSTMSLLRTDFHSQLVNPLGECT